MENKNLNNNTTNLIKNNEKLDNQILNLTATTKLNLSSSTNESIKLNNHILKKLKHNSNKNDLNEFICGWCAAFTNILITFPINKIMFRQMAYGVRAKSAVSQFKENLHLKYIYRGLLPPLLSKTISASIMFGTYHKYQDFLIKSQKIKNKNITRSFAAILAGCTEAILTPFERVQMLLQHKVYDHTFNNTIHAFIELKKYGIREYYRGLTPILLRNGPSNVVYFTSRDLVKSKFPQSPFWYINLLQDFTSGALIGAITSTIFYPLNAIRTKMQISPIENRRPLNLIEAFKALYIERDRKFRNFYYGVQINFTRSLLSWGIITTVFELTMRHLSEND